MTFREFIDLNVCWSIIKERDFSKLSGRQTLRKQLKKPGKWKANHKVVYFMFNFTFENKRF